MHYLRTTELPKNPIEPQFSLSCMIDIYSCDHISNKSEMFLLLLFAVHHDVLAAAAMQ